MLVFVESRKDEGGKMNFQGTDMYTRLIAGVGLLAAIVLFWAIGRFIIKTVVKLMKFGESSASEPVQLDTSYFVQSPGIALGQAKEEVVRMGFMANSIIEETAELIKSNLHKHAVKAWELEKAIQHLYEKISEYLSELSNYPLSDEDTDKHIILLETNEDIVRIVEHVMNIIRLIEKYDSNSLPAFDKYIDKMLLLSGEAFKQSLQAFDYNDKTAAENAKKLEEEINNLEQQYHKEQMERLRKGVFTGHLGIIYDDIVLNIELIGKHSSNISVNVLKKDFLK